MAETTADVRRDIELTRDRISDTLQQLEAKTNVMQIVRDHPWPAIAVAVGTGVLLSGSGSDIKAAAATATATRGASSRIGTVLDDVVANLMGGLSVAFQDRIESLVTELKEAIGAPTTSGETSRLTGSQGGSQPFGGPSSSSSATASGGESGAWAPTTGNDDRPQSTRGDAASSTNSTLGSTVGADAGAGSSRPGYQSQRAD